MAELNGKKILFSPRITMTPLTAGGDIDITSGVISVSPNEIDIGTVTTTNNTYTTTLAGTTEITALTVITGTIDGVAVRAYRSGDPTSSILTFVAVQDNNIYYFALLAISMELSLTKTAIGARYQTTAPSANNTAGDLKFVVLSAEPATKYDGYVYIITGA